jgi:hypothetical protein
MTKSADPYINVNQAVVRKGDVDVEATNGSGGKAKKVEGRLTAESSEGSSEDWEVEGPVVHREESRAVSLSEARGESPTKLQGKVATSKGQVSTPVAPGAEAPKPSDLKADWVDFAVSKGESRDTAEAMTKDELVDKYGE